jgi:hypothetical protein
VALEAIVRRLVLGADHFGLMTAQTSLVGLGYPVKVGVRAMRRERRHALWAAGGAGQQYGDDKDGG